jgi:thiol-disulfide isomerase/thioredoxin
MKTIRLFAVPAALVLFCLLPAGAAEGLKVGDKFPNLAQFQLEGSSSASLEGKVVLVDFWASWCAPCKASFPVMTDLHKRYARRGLVILAVSVDEQRAAMEQFLKKSQPPFAVVRDASQKLAAAVNARTMPMSFLIDGKGRVRFVHAGFKEDTGRQYEKEIEELLYVASN